MHENSPGSIPGAIGLQSKIPKQKTDPDGICLFWGG